MRQRDGHFDAGATDVEFLTMISLLQSIPMTSYSLRYVIIDAMANFSSAKWLRGKRYIRFHCARLACARARDGDNIEA